MTVRLQSNGGRTPDIRIGVAGWDYADWSGVVYPAGAMARFDRLAWIARFVDLVEINSTFYRPAAPRSAESWVRRTADPGTLIFTAKAHRSWTHEPLEDAPAVVHATLHGLAPLRDAGRFGALLIQFPQSFHFDDAARERLARLLELAEGWPTCVEVRHISWQDAAAEAWLRDHGTAWCLVDQPQVGRATLNPLPHVTAPLAYARLHGRNAANWFRREAGRDERYDYLYSLQQLQDLVPPLEAMAEQAEQLFVVQNNHFRGQALVNALQLKHLVEDQRPLAPQELVQSYPALEKSVRIERTRLF